MQMQDPGLQHDDNITFFNEMNPHSSFFFFFSLSLPPIETDLFGKPSIYRFVCVCVYTYASLYI